MTAHPKSRGLEFSCSHRSGSGRFGVAFLNRKGVQVRGVLGVLNDQKLITYCDFLKKQTKC